MNKGIFYQNLGIGQITDRFVPDIGSGSLSQFLTIFFWGFIFILLLVWIIIFIRGKFKYRYRAEIIKRRADNWQREAPDSKILEGKAGYFRVGKTGRDVFRIKYGIFPWQLLDVKKLPNPKYMEDNKVYFIQYNVGEITQARRIINWETGEIKIEPIDSTTKDIMKTELRDYTNIFTIKSKLQENAGIVIMGFVFIAGIVAFYFVTKACGA